ncbi:MAG: V-type ATP synthase subunit I [Candidatus Thermoplasmatota archaeon]
MFFPERMKDLTVLAHDDHVDGLIDSLHEEGVAEISDIDRDGEVKDLVEPKGISERVSELTDYDIKLSSILDIFDRLEPEKSVVKEFVSPEEIEKIKREKKNLDDVLSDIDGIFEEHGDKILNLDEKLTEINKKIDDLEQLRADLELISFLDIDLNHLRDSSFTVIEAGITKDPHEFEKNIRDLESYFYEVERTREEEKRYVVIAAAFIKDKNEFQSILRQSDVRPLDLEDVKGTPDEALDTLSSKIEELKNSREEILKKLKSLKEDHEKEYRALKEELDIHREKEEVLQRFGKTETTTILKGWAPEKNIEEVEKTVKRASDGYAEVLTKEPEDPDEVPTKLDNPKVIKPFELLTHMFAPPRYDEIDPTFILAPAFVIFFGLMLGDAIYGILIILTSIILLQGIGKVEEGTRNFSFVLLGVGISTFTFGILQGGYLGPAQDSHTNLFGRLGLDFINDLAVLKTLEGEGPLVLLIISLLIGLFYLNAGIFLQFMKYLKDKNYKEILKESVSWWTLQAGGAILISGYLFGWDYFFGTELLFELTGTVNIIGGVLTGIGLLLMVLRAKGLSFFELTGFIGDFLSFSRILALGLATSGIALTVNVLADLVSDNPVNLPLAAAILIGGLVLASKGLKDSSKLQQTLGAIVSVLGIISFMGYAGIVNPKIPFYFFGLVVMIVGHLINAVLQALGSFVHSLRLQYVEFFGYFYEGGGSEYEPFKAEREYTKIEEEVKG